jgi:hypothetical protein
MTFTAEQAEQLEDLAKTVHVAEAARRVGVNEASAYDYFRRNEIPTLGAWKAKQPPADVWINACRTEAALAGVGVKSVLMGHLSKPVVRVRWKAFARVLNENQYYTVIGLARTSGFDHTTILYGLARLRGERNRRSQRQPEIVNGALVSNSTEHFQSSPCERTFNPSTDGEQIG